MTSRMASTEGKAPKKTKRYAFCGAFSGTTMLRRGETVEQMRERVEQAMLAALDKHCKRLGINVGVDTDVKEA